MTYLNLISLVVMLVATTARAQTAAPSAGSVTVGKQSTLYDASLDVGRGCLPKLDTQIIPLSFAESAGVRLKFSAVDAVGRNYWVSGVMTDGVLPSFQVDCHPIYTSGFDPVWTSFRGAEWLTGFYKISDTLVYGMSHNEFYGGSYYQHGGSFPNGTCAGSPNACLYSTVTTTVSDARVQKFSPVVAVPGHVAARPASDYSNTVGAVAGYNFNTNVVRADDGYYYMLLSESGLIGGSYRSDVFCPARTKDLAVPAGWRAWNGSAYAANIPAGADCANVAIGLQPNYLGYNTYLNAYVAVGTLTTTPFTVSYAVSSDFVHWSTPVSLGLNPLRFASNVGIWGNYNYFTLFDPSYAVSTEDSNASSGAVTGRYPLLIYVDSDLISGTRLVARPLALTL